MFLLTNVTTTRQPFIIIVVVVVVEIGKLGWPAAAAAWKNNNLSEHVHCLQLSSRGAAGAGAGAGAAQEAFHAFALQPASYSNE